MKTVRSLSFGAANAFELGFGPVGPPIMTTIMYVLEGVVIDTGQHHMRKHVARILEGRHISHVLLTHHHEDHSGNAGMISKSSGAVIMGHPLMIPKMKKGFGILPYQHFMFGKTGKTEVSPCPDMIVTDRFRFRAIHTPGHSKDHIAYLEERHGWLFSGDLWLGEKIFFFRSDERIAEQIASLKKVLGYDFDALLCGHRPCPENGKAKIAGKLAFLEDFHGRVCDLVRKGYSEKAIIRAVREKSDLKVKLITMGNASFANMVRSSVRVADSQISR